MTFVKFAIYRPDGHTCPDVEGPLIRSKFQKKIKKKYIFFGGPKKIVKRTPLIRSITVFGYHLGEYNYASTLEA